MAELETAKASGDREQLLASPHCPIPDAIQYFPLPAISNNKTMDTSIEFTGYNSKENHSQSVIH